MFVFGVQCGRKREVMNVAVLPIPNSNERLSGTQESGTGAQDDETGRSGRSPYVYLRVVEPRVIQDDCTRNM
jgi:hypothetical protein